MREVPHKIWAWTVKSFWLNLYIDSSIAVEKTMILQTENIYPDSLLYIYILAGESYF